MSGATDYDDPTEADIDAQTDACGDIHVGDWNTYDCIFPLGHPGHHQSFGGSQWPSAVTGEEPK